MEKVFPFPRNLKVLNNPSILEWANTLKSSLNNTLNKLSSRIEELKKKKIEIFKSNN